MSFMHDCDGECVVCQRPACEFCGEVSSKGLIYCMEHNFDADNEDFDEEED